MLDRRSAERPTPCSVAQRDTRRSQRMDLIINQAIGPNDRNINPAANCMRLKGTRILLSRRRVSRFAAWLRVCTYDTRSLHPHSAQKGQKWTAEGDQNQNQSILPQQSSRDWELRLQRGGNIFSRVIAHNRFHGVDKGPNGMFYTVDLVTVTIYMSSGNCRCWHVIN
jgi:hypothetical protein